MKLYNEMEKAFLEIEKRFDTHSLERFLDCPYQNLSEYYDELELWIRNHLLISDCPLLEYFTDGNVLEKNDMSIFMIQSFYIYIHKNTNYIIFNITKTQLKMLQLRLKVTFKLIYFSNPMKFPDPSLHAFLKLVFSQNLYT